MQVLDKYVLAILLLFKTSSLFSMDQPKSLNSRPIASLKAKASQVVIKQLLHNSELLEKLTDPKQCPSEVLDFIKSKIHFDYHPLLLQLLPYKHKTLVGHQGPVTAVCLSKNCNYALTGSEDNTVRLWDLNEGICIKVFGGHNTKITALEFEEQELIFSSGSEDGNVRIWDIQTGNCIYDIQDLMKKDFSTKPIKWFYTIQAMEFFENFLVFKNNWCTAFWNLTEAKLSGAIQNITYNSKSKKYDIEFNESNDKNIFAYGPNSHITNKDTKEIMFTLSEHPGCVICGEISPNDTLAITGSNESVAKLWHIETGKSLHTFNEHIGPVSAVNFSNDNTKAFTVACSEENIQLKVWDVATGQLLDDKTYLIDKIPLTIVHTNNDYHITFSDGSGYIINQDTSKALRINKRIRLTKSYSLITCPSGNGVIHSRNHQMVCILDFDEVNSKAFDLKYKNNAAIALFGLDTNDCQLWTLVNDLSLEQLIFILQLLEKSESSQSIEYDNQILESFHPEQQIRLKKYFKLD